MFVIARSPVLGEFMGTFVLLLLGNGVCAAVTLKRSYAKDAGWMVVAAGWAFAVLCGIFVSQLFGSADAHMNPAFTLAFAIKGHAYGKLLPYILAQVAGAFCGATAAWLFYLPLWAETDDAGAKRGVFCTAPAVRNYGWALFCECWREAGCVLHGACCAELWLGAVLRGTGFVCPCDCCRWNEQQAGVDDGRCCGAESTFGEYADLVDWFVAGCYNGLCD
jgi:glycerol uptake facilitator-like aquaporin